MVFTLNSTEGMEVYVASQTGTALDSPLLDKVQSLHCFFILQPSTGLHFL